MGYFCAYFIVRISFLGFSPILYVIVPIATAAVIKPNTLNFLI